LREEPKPAGQIVEGLPRELERIIARCLRKDPGRRFQGMPDLKLALEELKEESDSGMLDAVPAPTRPYRWRPVWIIALLGIVSVFVALWFARTTFKAPEPTLTAVPLTTYPGREDEPDFSPDGNQVVFSWNGEKRDNQDLYVKLINTGGPPLRLTTDPADDHSPRWSPDGRFIAFLRDFPQDKSALLLIPALGGPERKVAEISQVPLSPALPGPYLAWSPDGNWLVVSDRASPREPFALFLLSLESGEKRRLTSPQAQLAGDSGPTFSPDGHTLAFSRTIDSFLSDLYLLPLSTELTPTAEPRSLNFENRDAASPTWTGDGHDIVFSSMSFGESGLWKIAASGSAGRPAELQPLTSLGQNVSSPTVSRSGHRLAYMHEFFHSAIWRIPIPVSPSSGDAGSPRPAANRASPVISSTRNDNAPQFSPDGKKIAFMSVRSGSPEIWVCDGDGSNALRLTSFGGPQVTTPRWAPDGTRIAFDSNAAGQYDIWVVGANGGKAQRMTTHPANDGNPSWSGDGRWIYFDSARTGEQQVWKIPAEGGEAIQVTRDGGFAPLESPDGKSLYYVKNLMNTTVWRMSLDGGQASKILEGLSNYLDFTVVQNGLFFVPTRDTGVGFSLQFLNFATNKIRPVANFEKPLYRGGLGGVSVSPDGRWILCTQFDQAGSELMLVENFR
jgi:Tol biopolymer transport system component